MRIFTMSMITIEYLPLWDVHVIWGEISVPCSILCSFIMYVMLPSIYCIKGISSFPTSSHGSHCMKENFLAMSEIRFFFFDVIQKQNKGFFREKKHFFSFKNGLDLFFELGHYFPYAQTNAHYAIQYKSWCFLVIILAMIHIDAHVYYLVILWRNFC